MSRGDGACRRAARRRARPSDDAAQHPLEGGAPTGEGHEVLVAGHRVRSIPSGSIAMKSISVAPASSSASSTSG